MVHVVDGNSVQQDQVFVGATAADVKSCESFVSALYARHQLDGFQDIGLAEEHRRVLDLVQRDVNGAQVGGLDAGVLLRHHHRLFQGGRWRKDDVDGGIPLEVQLHRLTGIAHVAVLQRACTFGDGECIIAIHVGDGAGGGFGPVGEQHAGAQKGFPALGVRDVTAYGGRAPLRKNGRDGQGQ